MNRLRRTLLLSFVVALAGCATTFPGASPAETREWFQEQDKIRKQLEIEQHDLRRSVVSAKLVKPFLWSLEKNGKRSYLLGTMHEGISSGGLPLSVRALIERSPTEVFESDAQQDPHFDASDRHQAPASLKAQLDPKAWAVLHHDLLWFDPELLDQLTPHQAHEFYLQARRSNLAPGRNQLDFELEQEARAAKKRLVYLEDFADLKGVFAALKDDKESESAAELSKFLMGTPLTSVKEEIAAAYRMALDYKLGELAAIEKSFARNASKDFYGVLIEGRNRRWLPKLEKELDQGGVFVAVGVAHMIGPASLLKLLAAKGYTATRMNLSAIVGH